MRTPDWERYNRNLLGLDEKSVKRLQRMADVRENLVGGCFFLRCQTGSGRVSSGRRTGSSR
jgi:hypothetical protein